MKSGGVLTDRKYKWFEPDAWRFGDGQVCGMSAPLHPLTSYDSCSSIQS